MTATTATLLGDRKKVLVQAELLGERIVPGASPDWPSLASAPNVFAAPHGGCAVTFRYGAVVFFGVDADDQRALRDGLHVRQRSAAPEREEVSLEQRDSEPARIDAGVIHVPDFQIEQLQLVAVALAKSVVLEHFERSLAASFDAIEPMARGLHQTRRPGREARTLLRQIGDALLAEQHMTGRVEVREKPDLLWDRPDLERFYARLETEYELRDRAAELERKLDLVSRTAHTALGLLQNRRALRVEWYIVVLIVIEIGLTLYELWLR